VTHPAKTFELIADHIPFPRFCCFAAGALEIAGFLALVLRIKIRWSALVLAWFVIIVTFIFHWHFTKEINVHLFRKDLTIAGGLLLSAYYDSTLNLLQKSR
jgi:uncharacterized membrane protein YphA (DoxX/SURF4 family)